MKLVLKHYKAEATNETLQFILEPCYLELFSNFFLGNLSELLKQLRAQIHKIPPLKLHIDEETLIFTLTNFNLKKHLPALKPFFSMQGITEENWKDFASQIESSKFMSRLPPVLLVVSLSYLSAKDRALSLRVSKNWNKAKERTYRDLLRTQFPFDYQQVRLSHNKQQIKEKIDYHKAFIKAHLRNYATLNAREKKLMTLFKEGNLTDISESKFSDKEVFDIQDKNHRSLLAWLHINKKQTVLDYLFQTKINYYSKSSGELDVGKRDEFNMQILHWAVACNQSIEAIKSLIDRGADINANSNAGLVFTLAVYLGNLEIIKYLLTLPNFNLKAATTNSNKIHFLAERSRHLEIVSNVSTVPDINLNATKTNDCTALMIAACQGHLSVVKHLSTLPGIDLNATRNDGSTALMMAAQRGHLAIVEHLSILPGVNPNATTKYGSTALIMAAQEGHLAVVKYLSTVPGINLNAATKYGNTALTAAAAEGHLEIVRYLSTLPGIDLNAATTQGETALMMAAQRGYLAMVKHLAAQPPLVLDHFTNSRFIADEQIQQIKENQSSAAEEKSVEERKSPNRRLEAR